MINFAGYNWQLPSIDGSADQVQAGVDHQEHVPFDLAGLFKSNQGFGRGANRLLLNPLTGQPIVR